jgi:trans-feruloyl-CoA hydratase/vanillin synthase
LIRPPATLFHPLSTTAFDQPSEETTMATKKYETIKVEKEDGITFVIFNRPDKRNAMSPQLHLDMDDALDDLATDEETQVLVITGAGEAFCAGQDIKLYFRGTETDPKMRHKARRASNQWRWQKLSTFPMPTIAMVNGFCFGGGFTQVCACDFAIAADDAVFGLSEVNWGILPGGIVSWNVTQTLNYRDSLYYAMTGDTFDGKKAKEIGFVNFSYPKAKLKEETVKLAKKLMEKSPAVLRYTKEGIRAVRFMNEPQAADYLNAKSDALKLNDKENSRQEGMKQFLDEKTYRPGLGNFKRKKAAAK